MTKRGFSLAELLITLGIIGIVASLTIPTLVSNNRNRANASKLASLVSTIENAFTTMMSSEAVSSFDETAFGRNGNPVDLARYLKIAGYDTNYIKYYGEEKPFRTIGSKTKTAPPGCTNIFQTKNGALLTHIKSFTKNVNATDAIIESNGSSVYNGLGYLIIDVNGTANPNVWGRDLFYFMIGDDGCLYPVGSKNHVILYHGDATKTWDKTTGSFQCNDTTKNAGCTARLVENNYEVDY